MRRRAKRDIFIIFGVVVALAVVALVNYNFTRGDLVKKKNAERMLAEKRQKDLGIPLLDWKIVTETEGGKRSGPTFLPELEAQDGQHVNLVGFIQPLQQFRNMTEMILLPLPIECYFCKIPPISHVVLIHMKEGETANMFNEPVVFNGTLKLNRGPNTKFFYTIEDAKFGAALEGDLTRRKVKEEHMVPQHEQTEKLQPGFEPPSTPDLGKPAGS